MKKVGFLFGAGAEISYGMPSGGKFSLDIFRQSTDEPKAKLKEMRDDVNEQTGYAANWLPSDYQNKAIRAYTQRVYNSIIKDTINNNKVVIINRINNFDQLAQQVLDRVYTSDEEDAADIFDKEVQLDLNKSVGDINIKQSLRYNKLFDGGNQLFESSYMSIFLEYYQNYSFDNEEERELLGDLLKAIFQLHIGALSSEVSNRVEDSVFDKQNLDVDFFDDLGGSLNVNYEAAGITGLKLLSDKKIERMENNIVKFVYFIVEQIYAEVLDYKTLIDSNWHYLYLPKTEWAKFTKISVFLYTVQNYIKEQAKNLDSRKAGYYSELRDEIEKSKLEVSVIATTNYSSFIREMVSKPVLFLNGGIDIFYDPYMNTLIDDLDKYRERNKNNLHIVVPLLFTQSGTKPMTSIDMSEKYVEFYERLKESDIICSVGFGFNPDDEHINGVIRTLVERDNKQLYIVTYSKDSSSKLKKRYSENLKISKNGNIHIIKVDSNRIIEGTREKWYTRLE